MNLITKFLGTLGIFGAVSVVLLWLAIVVGWVMNIIDIVGSVDGPVTLLLALRVVGIVLAPLGAALGWFF